MPNIAMFATLQVKEGRADEFLARLDQLMQSVEDEPGTLVYTVNQAQKNPDTIWFYEVYEDAEALQVHGVRTESVIAELLDEFLAARPELIMATPVMAKGLEIA